MKMTAQGFLTALKAVSQHDIDSVACLIATIHTSPKQLEGAQSLGKSLHEEIQRIDGMAGTKTSDEELTGDIAVTAIAYALGKAAGLAQVAAQPTLSKAIDDIASIAFGDGYDTGSGCTNYNATKAWDNFKEHTLPLLKERISGLPVPGYVQVPIESARFCGNRLLSVISNLFFSAEESDMATRYRTHINALLSPVENIEAQEKSKVNQDA